MENNCQVLAGEAQKNDDPDRDVPPDEEEADVDDCPVAEMCELRHLCGALKRGWGEGQTDLI